MARRAAASSSFQRPFRQRAIGRRIIISCEGAKTEYGYFEGIRKSLRMEPNKIIVVKPQGSDPLGVVREAVDERAERQHNQQWVEEDMAWAVFDGDEHIANNRDNWRGALRLAQESDIRLAISNPSFEYWYLLHYQDQTGHLTRQRAIRLLKDHLPMYEKAHALYQGELQPRTAEAVNRAKRAARLADANDLTAYSNPCTHVWELVEILLSLQKESR